MSEISVEVNPQDIEKAVVDAIVRSSIGTAIQSAVAEMEKKLSSSYDNPLKKVIESEVNRIALDVVRTKLQEKIRAMIEAKLDEAMVQQLFDSSWKAFMERSERWN